MPLPYLCTFNKQKMKVFKFGGASVSTVERIQNMAGIIKAHGNEPLMIIVSAMGKTTNALEKVVEAFYEGRAEEALRLFGAVKQSHLTTAKYLLVTSYNDTLQALIDFFTEVEWLLHDKPVKDFDYYYDQVVCIGELLSSCIVSAYMNEKGIANEWIDVRDVLKTDNNFREATVYWKDTRENLSALKFGDDTNIYITQGFIGSTYENESTTLGREGSDYTAAIFANLLSAESLTIWKDVEGVMSADPKEFPEATFISELSFNEVIEMAFYGAQVIHPKTIKPLQNKKIPLHVRSFINTSLPGTVISNKSVKNLPPIVIVKTKQVLVHLNSQDFSFVGEEPISELYKTFCHLHVKPNLIQTGAVTIQVCLDNRKDKIEQVAIAASEIFDVQIENALSLLTIRHYTDQLLNEMIEGKDVVLTQKTKDTVQVLYR
jgi:aspartate kinase